MEPVTPAPAAVITPTLPYERIAFDCDSTLSRIEGIEELARMDSAARALNGAGEARAAELRELTDAAMSGRVPLQDVYGKRLQLVSPRRNDVATLGRRYIEQAVPGAKDTLSALRYLGKELVIVSGGLRLAVVAFGQWLGVKDSHVHAVAAWFDGNGALTHIDTRSPLVRTGGKREIVAALPPRRTAFVGDGMTDAETADAVDSFVCFAGVIHRPEVAAKAAAVISSKSLAGVLPVLCTLEELDKLRRDSRYRALVDPGLV
jgi:phosphoserine phosphatase